LVRNIGILLIETSNNIDTGNERVESPSSGLEPHEPRRPDGREDEDEEVEHTVH
jgi:hypothetical protein